MFIKSQLSITPLFDEYQSRAPPCESAWFLTNLESIILFPSVVPSPVDQYTAPPKEDALFPVKLHPIIASPEEPPYQSIAPPFEPPFIHELFSKLEYLIVVDLAPIYIPPPPSFTLTPLIVAIQLVILEYSIVVFSPIRQIAPPSFAIHLSKLELEIFVFLPVTYTAPPFPVALSLKNMEEDMVVFVPATKIDPPLSDDLVALKLEPEIDVLFPAT